jgi:hypothetical protein
MTDAELNQADGRDALATHVETIFVFDESGRIVRNTDPDRGAGPRLYLGGCDAANVVRLRHDVGAKTAQAIEARAADEPPLRTPDSVPAHVDDYVALLGAESPVEARGLGVNYCFPPDFVYEHDVAIVSSEMAEAERRTLGVALDQVLPEPLVAIGFSTVDKLWTPWCVALHDGGIASLVETVRIGPKGAEAGVNTVPNLRGRGFAAAATAGWAASPSLRGRSLFYSTGVTNISSQRVTERLGLRFIGASFSLT